MEISTNIVNNEKIAIFIPYGSNRNPDFTIYCSKVWKKFNINVNFIEFPFPHISHGHGLNAIMFGSINLDIDYYIFAEVDSIPLKPNLLELVYDKIKDKQTLFSNVTQSNHLIKKNGTVTHPYAAPSLLCFSKELYLQCGKPTLDHTPTSDTAENFTEECEKRGFTVCLMWPKTVIKKNYAIGDVEGGMGNEFDLVYHQMQIQNTESIEMFKDRCNKILT